MRLYNTVFELINRQGESYFSGRRFIDIIREFNDEFPDYNKFLRERATGKSTSRKDYFYDILLSFPEPVRINIINRILEEIEQENQKEVSEVREMIWKDRNNYDTVFISYGDSDQKIAAKINLYLKNRGIKTWFFLDDALPGEKLHRMMYEGVNKHDRVLLICSEQSLIRSGLLNELERVLERETNEGGSQILLPIRLDDYVLTDWAPEKRDIASQVRSRVITKINEEHTEAEFNQQLEKIVLALAKK